MILVIGAVLLVLAAIVILTLPEESGTFTSKSMSAAHAHLAGQEKCEVCHVTQDKVSDQLCLECHKPLKERIAAKLGFHAQVQAECARCHGEHQGKDFQVIAWPGDKDPFQPVVGRQPGKPEELDHERATGFKLQNAHAPSEVACADCHGPELIRDPLVASFKGLEGAPKLERPHGEPEDFGQQTFLGVPADCSGCHLDPHVPTQGEDCEKCHGDKTFKPASAFDHGKTRFALAGKHSDLKCEECHLQAASKKPAPVEPPIPSFKGVAAKNQPRPFRGVGFGKAPAEPVRGETLPNCVNCHENPHRKQSKSFKDCTSCHDESAWGMAQGATFDHDKTEFPLEGAHADTSKAKCADCHGGKKLDGPIKRTCVDCHQKDDYHKGGFDREMVIKGQSCEMCHDARDWKKHTYPVKEHPEPIGLTDGHAGKCEKCHGIGATVLALEGKRIPIPRLPKEPGLAVDRGPQEKACAACHGDPHLGRMEREVQKDCVDCHDFKNFNLAELDNAGHAKIGFPIVDAHAALDAAGKPKVSCEDCHGQRNASGGLRDLSLTEVRVQGCVVCHEDPHLKQLGNKCAECHTEKVFEPSTFDIAKHASTRLPLRAAHLAVPCEECHARELKPGPKAKDPSKLVQRFKWEDPEGRKGAKEVSCESCHEDPHKQQFGATNCSSCHGEDHFEPSTFEVLAGHRRVGFPLEGPHATKCESCHVSGLKHGDAITYRTTPKDCAECHLDVHLGQFAEKRLGCQACHEIKDWKPERFDHDKCRFPLQGAHTEQACDACHLSRERVFPDGEKRQVVHYYPIKGRECGDCHQNPHSSDSGPSGSGKGAKKKDKREPTSGRKRGRK